ncbi:MAG: hypothetical protein U9P61_00245 [Patescibacteria group bacterium]|nr:hypothetical protein [Patescibacteria group bacterium]
MRIIIKLNNGVTKEHWIEKGMLFFLPQGDEKIIEGISLADISAIYNNNKKRALSSSLEPEERVLAMLYD